MPVATFTGICGRRAAPAFRVFSFCVLAWAAAVTASAAAPPEENAPLPIARTKQQWSLEWKTYALNEDENIALYGAKRRYFVTDSWYWGEAGYGAVSGRRGGYLEGGVIAGRQDEFFGLVATDVRLMAGAAGGAWAPGQGSGFILHPTVGLGLRWNRSVQTLAECGYIKFVNGTIAAWTLSVVANLSFWDLK